VNRASRAQRLPSVAVGAIGAVGAALAMLGCNARATRAECTEMLDRYLDMTVGGELGTLELSPAEAVAARADKKAQHKADPSYRRVQEQCEAEISRREYRCAMKAPSPETWQACID
jgi:hypothetical protein